MIPVGATIARIWRGWTTPENADAYQAVVHDEVLPEIFARDIPGLIGAHLLRAARPRDGEVEFTTVMWFDSLDSVKAFMGDDYERAHVPERARAVLKRFDHRSTHLEVLDWFAS